MRTRPLRRSTSYSTASVERELVRELDPLPRDVLDVARNRRPCRDDRGASVQAAAEEQARAAQVIPVADDDDVRPTARAGDARDGFRFASRRVRMRVEAG